MEIHFESGLSQETSMAITSKVRLQYTTKAATFLKACIPPRNSHTNCYEALSDQYDPRDNEYAISMDSGQHNSLKETTTNNPSNK